MGSAWAAVKLRGACPYSWWAAVLQIPLVWICWVWGWWAYLGLPPYPGLAIGFLAFTAVIMTVRAEYFTKTEQAAWVIIAFVLFGIESKSIYQDRNENQTQQQEDRRIQQTQFAEVLRQNEREFSKTMDANRKILAKTEQAADTATEAVDTMSGGNSFCYVEIGRSSDPRVREVLPVVVVVGKYPLSDVTMRVVDYLAFKRDFSALLPSGLTPNAAANLDSKTSSLGNIPVAGKALFGSMGINLDSNAEQNYNIEFFARNGNWREHLRSRKIGDKWAYAIRVSRFAAKGEKSPPVFQKIDKLLLNKDGNFDWGDELSVRPQ